MSYLETLSDRASKLRVQLNELVKSDKPEPTYDPAAGLPDWEHERAKLLSSLEIDLMVTHVEVNDLHGTGILIKRMFPDWRRIMHVWTCKAYPVNDFGIVQIFVSGWKASRYRMYSTGLEALRPYQIRRVMCVPFSVEDVYLAMAAADTRGVPLMTYIMDDQNLTNHRIPDKVMRELLEKSATVFVISPEMRDAYETKFGIKTFVLPPVVRASDLQTEPVAESAVEFKNTGVLLGNIWNKTWLDEIRHVIRDSGKQIHWYGNAGKFVDFDDADLEKDGIIFKGALPEKEICAEIRKYAFGVLPSSPDDQEDWLAKYSIPTRLVTSVAAGNLPMIVIGSEQSASSQFVKRFKVGTICPYDSKAFAAAVDEINQPERQREIRGLAAESAQLFSDDGDRRVVVGESGGRVSGGRSVRERVRADERVHQRLDGAGCSERHLSRITRVLLPVSTSEAAGVSTGFLLGHRSVERRFFRSDFAGVSAVTFDFGRASGGNLSGEKFMVFR